MPKGTARGTWAPCPSRYRGEAELEEGPVDLPPAERAGHGRPALACARSRDCVVLQVPPFLLDASLRQAPTGLTRKSAPGGFFKHAKCLRNEAKPPYITGPCCAGCTNAGRSRHPASRDTCTSLCVASAGRRRSGRFLLCVLKRPRMDFFNNLHSQPANAAFTASGTATALIRVSSSGYVATNTRVSLPSAKTLAPRRTVCLTTKVLRPHSTIVDSICRVSPKVADIRNFACASRSGTPMIPYLAFSCFQL